jgi:hypothetical protein
MWNEHSTHIDVGVETVPTSDLTFMWRRDFLEHFARCLHACAQDDTKITPNIYPMGFLRNICNSTIQIPISSRLRQLGLSYVQHYSTFKEAFAAGNTYPFSNENLPSLSLNSHVAKVLQYVGKAVNVTPEVLARAYIHSKVRCHHSLMAVTKRAFGCRWECRVTLALLRQIDQSMRYPNEIQLLHHTFKPDAWVAHETKINAQWYRINFE